MPKRSRERSDDEIEREIRRLKRKLEKRRHVSPSPVPRSPPPAETELESVECEDNTGNVDKEWEGNAEDPPTVDKNAGADTCQDLDETVLLALGDTLNTERVYGDEVHPEIIKRIESILTGGIKKEVKEELIKKYLIPKNAKLLDAPKLNAELQGLLNDAIKTRDTRVAERQQQLGTAIAAMLSVTHSLIKGEFDKLKVIGIASDVARLLSDLHYEDTATRRKLIAPNLDKNIAKSLETSNRDEFLFGSKFSDNVKAASAIKKSAASILKPSSAAVHSQKNTDRPGQSQKKVQGNYRAPPRPTQFKQGGGGKYQQRTSVRPQQRRPPAKTYQQKPVRQS